VTLSDFIESGTATENMGAPTTNNRDTNAAFVILGSYEPDFSKPILFFVRASVQLNPGEKTVFHWKYIEDPKYFLIDTIIADDGWVAADAAKSASVTSPDTSMRADSVISVPVRISDLSGTNVKQARLSFTLDTSVFEFVGATPGWPSETQVVAGLHGATVNVDVTSASALSGSGVLFHLQLLAKPRHDTVCSAPTNGVLTAINSDAYLGTVSVWLGQVCVFGEAEIKGVVDDRDARVLDVYPNPVTSILHLGEDPVREFDVFDVLGRLVYQSADVRQWQPSPALANGRYHVVAIDRDGRRREADVTLQR
jgi:hypothetical protein